MNVKLLQSNEVLLAKMETSLSIVFILAAFGSNIREIIGGVSDKGKNKSSSLVDNNVERFQITASPSDKRAYRGLRLKNDLKVVLISDPSTEKSAASMFVGVGGTNDFRDVPGLANLVAYVLVRGSKAYPLAYDLPKFVSNHGGFMNLPITRAHDQRFGFDIKPARLAAALERFANLFVEPLLLHATEQVLEFEIDFIENEYRHHEHVDEYLIEEVEKVLCRKNHPYCHLFLGRKETLYQHTNDFPEHLGKYEKTASLYAHVRKFHELWYSSNIMTLAVLGRENLDELESIVIPLFEKIENKKVKRLMFPHKLHPWGPEQLKHKIYIVPSSKIQLLRLSFAVPDFRDKYKTSPHGYIGDLVADEGPGSLYSVLDKKGLCKNLEVLLKFGVSFFTIEVELTDDGLKRVDEVVNLIFQYLHLVREKGIQEWIFEERRELLAKAFTNWSNNEPNALSFAEELALSMLTYPMEDIVSYRYMANEWDPSLIGDFLCFLRPNNVNISIASKSFSRFADSSEKSFGTRYFLQKIPEGLLQKWSTKEMIAELQLPLFNDYLPENFDLYPIGENEPKDPYLIHQSSISEIWFKQDDQFRVPKLCIAFSLHSPVPRFSPDKPSLFSIYHVLLTSFLKTYLDNATAAGFQWNVTMEAAGIKVILDGHNDKLPLFLERLLLKIINFEDDLVNEEKFENLLKERMKSSKSLLTKDHIFQLHWYTTYLQTENGWTLDCVDNAGKWLQYQDMKKFASRIFRRTFIRALIHGNCSAEKAMDIVNIIEKVLQPRGGLLLQEMLPPRAIEMTEGFRLIAQIFNQKFGLHAYSSHFQLAPDSTNPNNNVRLVSLLFYHFIEVLCRDMLSEPSKRKLETIRCGIIDNNGVRGFMFSVVTMTPPRQMHKRIESFWKKASIVLQAVSNENLKNMKDSIEMEELKNPSNLTQLSELYWLEITNRRYYFNRNRRDLEQLHSVTRSDISSFLEEMLGSQRRELAIYIFPAEGAKKTGSIKTDSVPSKVIQIDHMEDFKSGSNLLPYSFSPLPSTRT